MEPSEAPRSPTLMPPRKSVELEDSGAHELSDAEDDHFSDAQEDRDIPSAPSSPIPTTRVEKQVDDRESHGEVPGTTAYKIRAQDAVPDELEIIPDGGRSRSESNARPAHAAGTSAITIPKTVVEKVDPSSPSHGEVPGTKAHSKRKADAVPDLVRPLASDNMSSEDPDEETSAANVPTTVITKVDSIPSHGEVPGTEAFNLRKGDAKPDVVVKKSDDQGIPSRYKSTRGKRKKSVTETSSAIAADGGFGSMESDFSEEQDEFDSHNEQDKAISIVMEVVDSGIDNPIEDDFDDFEAGADDDDDDFGDFDEGVATEPEHIQPSMPPILSMPAIESRLPLMDLSSATTLEDMKAATEPYLDEIFPDPQTDDTAISTVTSESDAIFLTDRSLSLWSQLVAPPPLQPPNWVRSRIRRLFLVSLGVPVDLDEILPASKQKKLVLPSTSRRSGSQSPPDGRRPGSRVRLKQDNESSTSVDRQPSSKSNRKKKGAASVPMFDLPTANLLCATTDAALSNMTEEELQEHVDKLQHLTGQASEVLEYWLKQRDSALGDKEAFEGVIENLVKHARRVRS